jgi:hypothetical protein
MVEEERSSHAKLASHVVTQGREYSNIYMRGEATFMNIVLT